MSRTVGSSEIDYSYFFLTQIQLILLINSVSINPIASDKLTHRNPLDLKFSPQSLKLKTVLIPEVELLLVFFMNDHQNNSC